MVADVNNLARIPPHDLQAERAVLGCLLLEGAGALERAALEPTEFYLEGHRAIFAAMRALAERGDGVSVLTVEAELRELGQLELIGGPAHLALCTEEASIEVHLPRYAALVRREAARRAAIQACTQAITELFGSNGAGPAVPVLEVAARLGDQLVQLAGQADVVRAVPIAEVLAQVRAYLASPPAARDMVPTPIPELTQRLRGGLLAQELVYLGGRPGTSKTALAGEWASLAAAAGHRTLVVSREMSVLLLGQRFVAQQLRIPASSLRAADLWPEERARLEQALPRLGALPLWFADTAKTVGQIRRLARLHRPRFLVVDYVQLVRSPADARAGKRLEVTAVSEALKDLATRLPCSVLALSSLRRLGPAEAVGGGKKRRPPPALEDLKESGDMEADADVVLLLWQREEGGSDRQLSFAKLRGGPTGGTVALDWTPVYLQFNQVPAGTVPDREPGEDVPF